MLLAAKLDNIRRSVGQVLTTFYLSLSELLKSIAKQSYTEIESSTLSHGIQDLVENIYISNKTNPRVVQLGPEVLLDARWWKVCARITARVIQKRCGTNLSSKYAGKYYGQESTRYILKS